MIVHPSGPLNARIAIIGEAPGSEEEAAGQPFVGTSGWCLTKMLEDAGIRRDECFISNLCYERPPSNDITAWISDRKTQPAADWVRLRGKWVAPQVMRGWLELEQQLLQVKPNIVIAVGNSAMWALTGHSGIMNWRGSQLHTDVGGRLQCVPTIHPAAVLREWKFRQIVVHDLRRAARWRNSQWPIPEYHFHVRPTFSLVRETLVLLHERLLRGEPLRISFDLETRAGHIACAGLAWSIQAAICIPFQCVERKEGYWTEAEELEIIRLLCLVLTAPSCRVVGQNIMYDCQYTWRHWGFVPRVAQDTMISQHALFSDLPKSLAFLASMYSDYYLFWKEEGRNWDASMPEDQLWHYNCLDCTYTLEVADALERTVRQMKMGDVHGFQQAMLWPVLAAMQLGIRIDPAQRGRLIGEVQAAIELREAFLTDVLGHAVNPDSPKQMMALFYGDLKLPIQMTRAVKGKPGHATLNDDSLQKLAQKEPLIRPLVAAIGDIRTLRKFLSNFLCRQTDPDGRWRCSFNIGGSASGKSAPKTYRLSSSESAFNTGANLQNIPSEKSRSLGKADARARLASTAFLGDPYQFPNIRSIFIPNPGCSIIELDLQRADLFVVCWECDDTDLKAAMLAGADMHLLNSFVLEGHQPPPLEELVEGHPAYAAHRAPLKLTREFAKVFVHGTNYSGGPATMAAHTGRDLASIKRAQDIWFTAHPRIRTWHTRVQAEIAARRSVGNKFGYRWQIFDRIDTVLPEAIAWIPQSTVSIVINRIWLNIFTQLPWVQVLAQVHDSLLMQCPTERMAETLPQITACSRITIPYKDPLVIPVTIKHSAKSWGDC